MKQRISSSTYILSTHFIGNENAFWLIFVNIWYFSISSHFTSITSFHLPWDNAQTVMCNAPKNMYYDENFYEIYSWVYRHTDPPTKRVLEEHSLLKILLAIICLAIYRWTTFFQLYISLRFFKDAFASYLWGMLIMHFSFQYDQTTKTPTKLYVQ